MLAGRDDFLFPAHAERPAEVIKAVTGFIATDAALPGAASAGAG